MCFGTNLIAKIHIIAYTLKFRLKGVRLITFKLRDNLPRNTYDLCAIPKKR